MFKKDVDLTNEREMFEFIKGHFTYATMSTWNNLYSIANNVKVYNLKLDGDPFTALNYLRREEYFLVNSMIGDWARDNGYDVGFNGRGDGYLVLYNKNDCNSAIPNFINDCKTYEEFERFCKIEEEDWDYYIEELRKFTKVVQSFDGLCDEIREYVNNLSMCDFVKDELINIVEEFNDCYGDELERFNIKPLAICGDEDGILCTEVFSVTSLRYALIDLADRAEYGYRVEIYELHGEKILRLEDR